MERRIAIYLGDSEDYTPLSKIKLNYSYTSKFESILRRSGEKKTSIAKMLLMHTFNTNDISELREKILYASGFINDSAKTSLGTKRRIAIVCKNAIKSALDKGYLL